MREFNIGSDFAGMRLDRFIKKACPDIGKNTAQKLIRRGDVKVNGIKGRAETALTGGDTVKIYVKNAEEAPSLRINMSLPNPDVIYEDDCILAVNKPPYLPSQPNTAGEDSVSERIKKYLAPAIESYGGLFVPGTANRLDTNTSGIILAGKTPDAARQLAAVFAANKADKRYRALVYGHLPQRVKATHYAAADPTENKVTVYDNDGEGRRCMSSVFTPAEYIGDYTLTDIKLITGRKHQIRAQLAHIGYPVVMDGKYGDRAVNEAFKRKYALSRQFLHCGETSLTLWYDGSLLKITCEMPADLNEALAN